MPSQKLQKPVTELPTEEAIKRLFPREVIAHAKDRAVEPDRVMPERKNKSTAKE